MLFRYSQTLTCLFQRFLQPYKPSIENLFCHSIRRGSRCNHCQCSMGLAAYQTCRKAQSRLPVLRPDDDQVGGIVKLLVFRSSSWLRSLTTHQVNCPFVSPPFPQLWTGAAHQANKQHRLTGRTHHRITSSRSGSVTTSRSDLRTVMNRTSYCSFFEPLYPTLDH